MNCFQFERKDRTNLVGKAWPLWIFISEHPNYLEYVCEALLKFNKVNSLTKSIRSKQSRHGVTQFERWIANLDLNNIDEVYINEFKSIFIELYDTSDQQELRERRGAVLELIVEKFVSPRYLGRGKLFDKGCMVKYQGRELITKSRKTVDIAGWDGKVGEFYETKVGPENFDEDVIELLNLIKTTISADKITSSVGCVTMVNRIKLQQKLQEKELDISRLQIIGKCELITLRDYPIIV